MTSHSRHSTLATNKAFWWACGCCMEFVCNGAILGLRHRYPIRKRGLRHCWPSSGESECPSCAPGPCPAAPRIAIEWNTSLREVSRFWNRRTIVIINDVSKGKYDFKGRVRMKLKSCQTCCFVSPGYKIRYCRVRYQEIRQLSNFLWTPIHIPVGGIRLILSPDSFSRVSAPTCLDEEQLGFPRKTRTVLVTEGFEDIVNIHAVSIRVNDDITIAMG